jgi:hypothetical protein
MRQDQSFTFLSYRFTAVKPILNRPLQLGGGKRIRHPGYGHFRANFPADSLFFNSISVDVRGENKLYSYHDMLQQPSKRRTKTKQAEQKFAAGNSLTS